MEELKAMIEALGERLSTVEANVNDLTSGLKEAAFKYQDEQNFNAFNTSYGERLLPFVDKMKFLVSDEYDLIRELYNAIKEVDGYGTDGFDEAGLMNDKIAELESKLGAVNLPEVEKEVTEGEPTEVAEEPVAESVEVEVAAPTEDGKDEFDEKELEAIFNGE